MGGALPSNQAAAATASRRAEASAAKPLHLAAEPALPAKSVLEKGCVTCAAS